MLDIEKAIPTHLPVSHVPKDSMNAPKGLCDINRDPGEIRPRGAIEATRNAIIGRGKGVYTAGFGLSCRARTTTCQEVIDLLDEDRVILNLDMSEE